jgi:hypothetical protein
MDSSITADTEEVAETPTEMKQQYYGLTVYEYDGGEYAVADSDDAADEACAEYIRENLWTFRASFIADHIPTEEDWQDYSKCISAIEEMQGKMCESANPIIRALLGKNLDAFIDAAIEADGRGQYLSSVDNEEAEGEDIYPGWKGKLAYRIN